MASVMLHTNMVAFMKLLSNFRLDLGGNWWAFNFVANWASIKFSYMKKDILAKQKEIEGKQFLMQEALDTAALKLHEKDPALAKEVRRLIMMRQKLTFRNIKRVPG